MGLIGLVLSYVFKNVNGFNIPDVKTDTGGGDNRTAQHFQPANMASRPLPDDLVALLPVPGAGRVVAVAYGDPSAPDDLEPGEVQIYSRDSDGNRQVSIKLLSDGGYSVRNINGGEVLINANGSSRIGNSNGGVIIDEGGVVTINGFTIDTSGNSSTSGTGEFGPSLVAGGKDFVTHFHLQPNDSDGNTEAPTGPPA